MSDELNLSKVTYLCVLPRLKKQGNNSIESILKIGHETSKGINFYDKVIYTPQEPECETYDFRVEKIEDIKYDHYTSWLFSNSKDLFVSDFMINFHADGMIQNPKAWEEDFFNYDYIGAPWGLGYKMEFPDGKRTVFGGGNGGFSLRSKTLCQAVSEIDVSPHTPQKDIQDNEDILICKTYKDELTKKGIKYAPTALSARFSTEHFAPGSQAFAESFGFHEIEKLFNKDVKEYRRNFLDEILKG